MKSSRPVPLPAVPSIRVVDADVHHNIRDKSDLYPYLTKIERARLEEHGMPRNTSL